jgi:hypothetical protein
MLSRALLVVAVLFAQRAAFAQTDAAGAIDYLQPKKKPASLPRTHDGVYLGLQGGPSYFSASSEPKVSPSDPDPGSREFTGPSMALRFAIGGTAAKRVAIAGMIAFEPVLSLTAKDEYGDEFDTYGAKFVLRQQGVLLDYYFQPQGGFHALGSIGFSQLAVTRTEIEDDDSDDPSGTYWMLGAGHEWWVGDDATFGLLASVTSCSLEVEERTEVDVNLWSFGLAVTATIN